MAPVTPNQIGTYQRYMMSLWDERDNFLAPTGFQSIFGRPETGAETLFSLDAEVFDMDIIRNAGEHYSKLIPRGGIQRSLGSLVQSLNEQKYSEVSRVFPYSVELFDISSGQLNKRLAGEPIHTGVWSREKRLRKLAAKGMVETVKRTIRMFEVLAAQSALTGKQDGIIGETTPQYDWRRNAANTIDVDATSTKWSAASPDPIGNLDSALDQIRINGGRTGDVCIMGQSCYKAFIRLTENQTFADNRRFDILRVSPNNPVPRNLQFMVDGGFDSRAMLTTYAGRSLWIFTYLEGRDVSGTWTPYMPVDEVLMFFSGARCDRQFGPPETLPADRAMLAFYQDRFGMSPNAMPSVPIKGNSSVIRPDMFWFDAYGNSSNTTITHRTQSAPVFGTTEVDSFALLTNVV